MLGLFSSLCLSAQEFVYVDPSRYICSKVDKDFVVDGNIYKKEWIKAPWTDLFVDIEGRNVKRPYLNTKAKMLWSDSYLYFAFEMEEPHIWAKLTQRDTVIFYDNDIEIFIDANGDTHNYYELEVNAFNTIWDLFLCKPYREGGPVLNEFDFKGLKTAVKIQGTLNNPDDRDTSWTVEVAIPWTNLITTYNSRRVPREGESMRINFSRVQWDTYVINRDYVKKRDPKTGRPLPENNWVWSPIGAIDMHRPENWGIVTFVERGGKDASTFFNSEEEMLRQLLSFIYKKQKAYRWKHGCYTPDFGLLGVGKEMVDKYKLKMGVLENSFEIGGTTPSSDCSYICNTEGKLNKQLNLK